MRSPAARPDCSAGEPAMVEPTTASGETVTVPTTKNRPHKRTMARTKFMIPPAAMTIMRFQTGLLRKDLSFKSSSSVMPAMRLNPPRGMARREYSVSPRRTLYTLGPKPSANSSTCIPAHLAVAKWPSSWTKTMTLKTKIVAKIVRPTGNPLSTARKQHSGGPRHRPGG